MNPATLCAAISDSLPKLFECAVAPEGAVRIRTPFMYPDGDIIDVFIEDHRNSYLLTDYGETIGWLRMQTYSGDLTTNQLLMVEDTCSTLNIVLDRGQLTLECSGISLLGDSVIRLGQACVRASDIWFTFRTRTTRSVADEVDTWLYERALQHKRSTRETGRSGREWTIDFRVVAQDRESLVFILSAGAATRARQLTERVVATCIDLSHLTFKSSASSFISLFDDANGIWKSEDYELVGSVARTASWSRPNEFEKMLTSDWSPPPLPQARL